MQPVEAQQGVSTKSQLFNSLKVYLNNKNRLQPIIGLSSIIECVKAGTQNREVFYLCEVCVCRLSKSDMRNHIMGSLHRYNYIKASHPHLVPEWKEKSDLSKLAWPLMEVAKVLEGNEGPGEVQWLEVEDAVYQKMATLSENDAVTLITVLRDGQEEPEIYSETTAVQPEHCPIQWQRVVLLSQNQDGESEKFLKTSAETNKSAAFINSEGWLKNTSPGPSVLSENSSSFLDDYTGTKPLIGLFRVVECRSEGGHTHCFLCHCCRIRLNKKDIIDHLTRSSHLVNYLMEIHPSSMMADMNDNYQLLQSLAKKVEQEEGRGELKVVNVPESLCRLLTGKSYNWCIKMLRNGWAHTNIPKQRIAVKGPRVNKTSYQDMPRKCTMVLSQGGKKMTAKRKMSNGTNTVFNVSLPLTKGSTLLKRSSFTMESPLPSAHSSSSDPDLIPGPESQSEDCELDYDTGSFPVNQVEHASQLQQDLCSGNADSGRYIEPERRSTVSQYDGYGYFSDDEFFNQSKDLTVTKCQKVYGGNIFNQQHGYQERSRRWFYEDRQTQNMLLSPDLSQTQDWSTYNCSYGQQAGGSFRLHTIKSSEGQNRMTSRATHHHHYFDQEPQNQYVPQDRTSLQTASVEQHGLSGELPARIHMSPCFGHPLAHSGSFALDSRVQFPEIEQKMNANVYGHMHHWL